MESEAYIAIGSNLGDRELNLLRAVSELGRLEGCRVTALSRFYETSPVGMPAGTPPFYNGVLRLATTRPPHELLAEMLRIEREQFGRPPGSRGESRRIDLDLLLYEALQLESDDLVLPHPRMPVRRFVLAPLAEIAPALAVPGIGRTVAELLAGLDTGEQVRPLEG